MSGPPEETVDQNNSITESVSPKESGSSVEVTASVDVACLSEDAALTVDDFSMSPIGKYEIKWGEAGYYDQRFGIEKVFQVELKTHR